MLDVLFAVVVTGHVGFLLSDLHFLPHVVCVAQFDPRCCGMVVMVRQTFGMIQNAIFKGQAFWCLRYLTFKGQIPQSYEVPGLK